MQRTLIAAAVLAVLCLAGLGRMGLVSKDEPRYADIGRAMARTHDFTTPRLSGSAWFEKPPLLYWLEAAGYAAGLDSEWAPRLPVALLSLGFLIFFWIKLRRLFSETVANYATAILATSAGWFAFSHVAVTDLPLAVTFTAAVVFAVERRITATAAALAFAVLAKSLVPLVLFTPVLALDYRNWRAWLRPAPVLTFLAVVLPWHILCALRNGPVFWRTLFFEHQFGRFTSTALQHVQPWWFYVPVLLLLLFPWIAFIPFAVRGPRVFAAVAIFGFVFFSASINKLPGYLLPLLPSVAVLIATGMDRARSLRIPAAVTALLLAILLTVSPIIPIAIGSGLRGVGFVFRPPPAAWIALALAAAILLLPKRWSFPAAAAATAATFLWVFLTLAPKMDTEASARSVWREAHPACVAPYSDRGLVYGLNYYAGYALPECTLLDRTPTPVVR